MSINLPTPSSSLPVALEVMGGDFGLGVAVEAAVSAAIDLGISTILVGSEPEIRAKLRSLNAESNPHITLAHAGSVITMDESPGIAVRRKSDSSIRVAFELAKDGKACGVVSAGNTGAVMAAGMFVMGVLPGIVRPAIASLIPKATDAPPTVLLDSGANVECHAHQLVQFALMGSYYASSIIGVEKPRVALLSNGSEASKGTDITRSAAQILSQLGSINFIGYVEGRDMGRNVVDVVVCDGFVGNVLLKAMEGTAELVIEAIKHHVDSSTRGKFGMWLARPLLKAVFREKLDPSAYGGAPLLGLKGVAVVCHGASNARGLMNGIRVAHRFASDGMVAKLGASLSAFDLGVTNAYEDGIWGRMERSLEKGERKKSSKRAEVDGDVSLDKDVKG